MIASCVSPHHRSNQAGTSGIVLMVTEPLRSDSSDKEKGEEQAINCYNDVVLRLIKQGVDSVNQGVPSCIVPNRTVRERPLDLSQP